MKHWITSTVLALVLPLTLSAHAAGLAAPSDLPDLEQARAAIEQDPAVNQARHAVQAATHTAGMLAASPYEWTASTTAQRRRIDGAGNGSGSSNEWSVQLERTLRIGGKAALDRDLGDAGLQQARAQLGAARNESARLLLDLWLDWLTARQTREVLLEQLQFAQANVKAVETRRKAGDASMLERNVAQGDLAEVQRQVSATAAAESKAHAALRVRFPQLPLQARALSEPTPLDRDEAQWRAQIAAGSDLLRTARQALRKAELTAARTRADRLPDPTVGVFTASEAFRSERVVGLSLSFPLGGRYRDQSAREALSQVEVARASLERQSRDLDVQIATQVSDAVSGFERWQLAEQSAGVARDSARLTQRAFSLGEADLQALLMVRRQSMDAVNAAVAARADALRARYKLLIDARLLWNLAGVD
ncbi:TolC family protein [Rhodoferax sp.]|uniref:TolC family protein n=1 Tax=Rhodoferax sp. TaxID=50421 RepID=UPI0027596667|nr:TolC family protein [Rhodoferax sp.]